jgi:predicted lipoprotein
MHVMKFLRSASVSACLLLAGCRFVATADETAESGAANDPVQQVAAIWDSKVIPYMTAKSGSFADVRAAALKDPEAAGKAFGFREKQGTSPWTVVVKLEGKVIAANTESKAATLDVDADGDGKADAKVQIGPVIKGTALRDCLDFVSFNQFTNQIDFAQFGKALNTHVYKATLSKLPRDQLAGKKVKVLGAYPLTGGNDLPLVTPATIELQ